MEKLKEMLLLDAQGIKGLKKAVLACLLTSLSLMIPFTITLQVFNELMKPLMGEVISWNHLWLLFAIGFIGFALVFFLSKNDYKKTYVNSYTQAEGMRLRVADHMRKLPMSFFNSRDVSELASNIMSDCTNIEQTMSSAIPQLLANIISISLVCILLAFFDWRMALAVFITLPLALLVFWLSRKIQGHAFKGQVEAKLESEKQSQEYIEGIKVIRSCGLEGDKFKALDDAFVALKKASLKVELISGSALALSSMLLRAGVGVTAFVGVLLLTGGQINFLTMLMFLLIVVRIYGPLLTVLTLLPDLLYLKVSSKRLRVLMETLPLEGQQKEPLANCDIEFEKVTFAYNEEDVLREVSFTAPSKKITALVGPSGSGKSTVLKLIGRFWDVDTGKICIGGKDIKELDPEYLLEHISVVFQEVTLFNDTIENNIRIGKKVASDEEVRAAAKAACCDEFVRQLPEGYQTLLGENGSTLSGGERQRISIARALLKDAPIILLDEATASLDPENEVLIQKAISRVVENKTTLVVAHRLKTIQQADQIVVFDQGRVKEAGSHQELMALNGLYQRLWEMQQLSLNWNI